MVARSGLYAVGITSSGQFEFGRTVDIKCARVRFYAEVWKKGEVTHAGRVSISHLRTIAARGTMYSIDGTCNTCSKPGPGD